ncbi:transcriptional regulator with XRE-family HTH domain [Rhizobium petrolearium]|uniref:Helix-turn-helix transcriptional regulator n=2 Tax=Neorhizobium TaxID=1525371 RepID=A0ABV0MC01_9HYPH|nr:helix-turn-helix transcriptional regulator [Neorhizobium petrolearium]MBP1848302.1 transcriptional regulator with XRE-family HTH domain [Neorhizobium petrolearium]WGI72224.1 helix-turn-helix transcriptional regulator [Neorhizobium petrolearium]
MEYRFKLAQNPKVFRISDEAFALNTASGDIDRESKALRAMEMTAKTQNHIESAGLVEARDPEIDSPIYRREGFEGIVEFGEMDKKLGEALRIAREEHGLTRPELVPLVGLTPQVYGRYERGEAKLHVTRLVHLGELLDFSPLDLIFAAAPHLWGTSENEAKNRYRLMKHIEKLPAEKTKLLLEIVESFLALQPSGEAKDPDHK